MVIDLIEREVHVPAPIDRVWRVLTTAEHIRSWYAFGGAEVDLRPGGVLRLRWDEHGEFHARVEQVEPLAQFSFRLATSPDVPPRDGGATLVEFTLAPEDDGTRLIVTETGIDTLEIPDAEKSHHAEYAGMQWTAALEELGALAAASHD